MAIHFEPIKIMRMGGWSDLKTFQIYVHMGGVDVKGVSGALDVLPSASLENVFKSSKYSKSR